MTLESLLSRAFARIGSQRNGHSQYYPVDPELELRVLGTQRPVQRTGYEYQKRYLPHKAGPGELSSARTGGAVGYEDYRVGPPARTAEKPFFRSQGQRPSAGRYQTVGTPPGQSPGIQDKGS